MTDCERLKNRRDVTAFEALNPINSKPGTRDGANRAYRPPKNLARSNDVFDKIEQARLPLVTVDESGAVVNT